MMRTIDMVTKTFEIYMLDPISGVEFEWWEMGVTRYAWNTTLTNSGRILLVEGPEDIRELIAVLVEHEFHLDIGNIKETTHYEPIYTDQDNFEYVVTLED